MADRTGRRRWTTLLGFAILLVAFGCKPLPDYPAPERIETPFVPPQRISTISVPVRFDLDQLEGAINRATPQALWSIDEQRTCAAPARATLCLKHVRPCKGAECRDIPCKIGFKRAAVTPTISCRIVGQVTRGPIRMSGRGETIMLAMPVKAVVQARDIGGIIKHKTATAAAVVRATVRLGIDRNWTPRAKVALAYDWTEPPSIELLGQKVGFARRADSALQKVIAGLERDLPRMLPRDQLRSGAAAAWRSAFTTIELNRDRPPAWMRVTPRGIGLAGYRIAGRTVEARVIAEAVTETRIGARPDAPAPTPLPPPLAAIPARGLNVAIPVLADYGQLEPVLKRALDKLARKPVELEGIGPVKVAFGKVTLYPIADGRLAVGIEAEADAVRGPLSATHGKVWLTALPYNEPGSEVVRVRDLQIFGRTDRAAVDLLISLFMDRQIVQQIEGALVQDFNKDYERVLAAARKAIAERQLGDFRLNATITGVSHGQVVVTGSGLFMPTEVTGEATIRAVR